jgi:carnitine O-palmitoyltransferase 2
MLSFFLLHFTSCFSLHFSHRRYLSFVEPLLNDDQEAINATRAAVEEFRKQGGDGSKLHEYLVNWDKQHKGTSYISQMWYEMYLQNRDPLPLNLAPQITWLDHADPRMNDQVTRSACLMHAAARFFLTMRSNRLEPDVFHTKPEISKNNLFQHFVAAVPRKVSWFAEYLFAKAYPLDMSQYQRLFHSTRIPKHGEDKLWSSTASDGSSSAKDTPKHVIIQRGPRFYKVDVLRVNPASGDLEAAPLEQIEAQLRGILQDLPTTVTKTPPYLGPSGPSSTFTTFDYSNAQHVEWSKGGKEMRAHYEKEAPIGALTGLHRDEWADARESLEKSGTSTPMNIQSLTDIDSALFVLTLEHACPQTHEDLSRAMLHGDGRNRWFDKCFNIIVCGNGKAGISWEHAWGDGVAVLYFFNEVYKAINSPEYNRFATSPAANAGAAASGAVVKDSVAPVSQQSRVAFDLASSEEGKKVLAAVRSAEAFTDKVVSETDLRVYASHSMTKADVKKSGLNPDGLMQM